MQFAGEQNFYEPVSLFDIFLRIRVEFSLFDIFLRIRVEFKIGCSVLLELVRCYYFDSY